MGNLRRYRTDLDALKEGAWFDFGDPSDPIRFRLAFFQHGLAEEIQRLPADMRRRARQDKLKPTELLGLIQDATANCIILDWENMETEEHDEDGNVVLVDVPYSPEKALEILKDEAYGELHEFILQASKERANFRAELLRESAGN